MFNMFNIRLILGNNISFRITTTALADGDSDDHA